MAACLLKRRFAQWTALAVMMCWAATLVAQPNNTQKKFCRHVTMLHDAAKDSYRSLASNTPISVDMDDAGFSLIRYRVNRPLFNNAVCEIFSATDVHKSRSAVLTCDMISKGVIIEEAAKKIVYRFTEKFHFCLLRQGIKSKAELPRFQAWSDQKNLGWLSQRTCTGTSWIVVTAGAVGGVLSKTSPDYERHRINTLQVSFGDHTCEHADSPQSN